MRSILLFGSLSADLYDVFASLEANLPYEVTLKQSPEDALQSIVNKQYQLVVVFCDKDGKQASRTVRELRSAGLSAPVLLACPSQFQENHFSDLRGMGTHFLARPFSEKELLGLTKKLLSSRKIPQQHHRRFGTNQQILVEALGTGDSFESNMYNLSKGGAYFETEGTKLKVGDILRLQFSLDDVEKSRTLNAKVVWATKKGRYSGRKGMGVKFVSKQEVHRHLNQVI